jgi:hypothetical protein
VGLGDALVLVGNVLLVLGLGITGLVYRRQKMASEQRDLEAAVSVLLAVRDGIPGAWGDLYFGKGYDPEEVIKRAEQDFEWVSKGGYGQVFAIPTELFTALFASAPLGLIFSETIAAAGVALWKMRTFNQLVRQQIDFNVRHLAEFVDEELPPARRQVLAKAARSQSHMIHNAIGDAGWYGRFIGALDDNIAFLRHAQDERLRQERARRLWT